MRVTFLAAAAATMMAGAAAADPLPADAKPLAAESLAAFYAGKTADWKTSKAYFAPDGTLKGINTENGASIYWGKWTVKGNEVCMVNDWRNTQTGDSGGPATDCWKWYVDGSGTFWQLWSVRYTGQKPPRDDYYTGEEKKFRKGDKVSKQFDKLNT